jgi:hypothetical protein
MLLETSGIKLSLKESRKLSAMPACHGYIFSVHVRGQPVKTVGKFVMAFFL